MKRFLVLAAFGLFLALPAHAQFGLTGGSVGGGGGINGGNSHLPDYPPTSFASTYFTGADTSFIPSAFVNYEQAIAAGNAALAAKSKTVANAASETKSQEKPRARFAMVQDANGKPVIVSR
jgi:hypothetical protein